MLNLVTTSQNHLCSSLSLTMSAFFRNIVRDIDHAAEKIAIPLFDSAPVVSMSQCIYTIAIGVSQTAKKTTEIASHVSVIMMPVFASASYATEYVIRVAKNATTTFGNKKESECTEGDSIDEWMDITIEKIGIEQEPIYVVKKVTNDREIFSAGDILSEISKIKYSENNASCFDHVHQIVRSINALPSSSQRNELAMGLMFRITPFVIRK